MELEVKNFKGIEYLKLELSPITVYRGDFKSSLLEAILINCYVEPSYLFTAAQGRVKRCEPWKYLFPFGDCSKRISIRLGERLVEMFVETAVVQTLELRRTFTTVLNETKKFRVYYDDSKKLFVSEMPESFVDEDLVFVHLTDGVFSWREIAAYLPLAQGFAERLQEFSGMQIGEITVEEYLGELLPFVEVNGFKAPVTCHGNRFALLFDFVLSLCLPTKVLLGDEIEINRDLLPHDRLIVLTEGERKS